MDHTFGPIVVVALKKKHPAGEIMELDEDGNPRESDINGIMGS
jgi:hypothetical protein